MSQLNRQDGESKERRCQQSYAGRIESAADGIDDRDAEGGSQCREEAAQKGDVLIVGTDRGQHDLTEDRIHERKQQEREDQKQICCPTVAAHDAQTSVGHAYQENGQDA